MTKQAKKGGELGANGEWYDGGRFINTIPENSKVEGSKPKKPRKVEVEPYVWVIDPEGRRPIFSVIGHGAEWIDRYNPEKGIRPYEPAFKNGVMYNGETYAEIKALCERWNAGERWR